jgi:hypothetical protein
MPPQFCRTRHFYQIGARGAHQLYAQTRTRFPLCEAFGKSASGHLACKLGAHHRRFLYASLFPTLISTLVTKVLCPYHLLQASPPSRLHRLSIQYIRASCPRVCARPGAQAIHTSITLLSTTAGLTSARVLILRRSLSRMHIRTVRLRCVEILLESKVKSRERRLVQRF